jgi:hypothetical protein
LFFGDVDQDCLNQGVMTYRMVLMLLHNLLIYNKLHVFIRTLAWNVQDAFSTDMKCGLVYFKMLRAVLVSTPLPPPLPSPFFHLHHSTFNQWFSYPLLAYGHPL